MNMSTRFAAALIPAAMAGTATLGMAGPAFAADHPHPENATATMTKGVATAPVHPGGDGRGDAHPDGSAEDRASGAADEGSAVPGTVQVGGVPTQPQGDVPPSTDGPNLHDLAVLVAGFSETCLNEVLVELNTGPDGEVVASLSAEDIADAIAQAGVSRLVGALPQCVVSVATQLSNGILPPEATQRLADQLGIDLPANLLRIGQVE
ncbi:hypothetical protein [Streptomyces glaucescens]|uniref:Putative secreted protein n=1 Tax=Streptomyces glaucescens TaxID=1907 RepID=A0A089WXK8_STRGA|nr:hypothetical protein [Streptomyces glaucescens]AIR96162.1 putative secreted protein [Streptomyces glaucescens]